MQIAVTRIKTGISWIKRMIKGFFYYLFCCCLCKKRQSYDQDLEGQDNPVLDKNNPDNLKSDLNSANSHISNGTLKPAAKENLLLTYMDNNMLLEDSNIGRGMEVDLSGKLSSSESSAGSLQSGDSGWRRSKLRTEATSPVKTAARSNMESSFYVHEMPQVEEVMYDPVDEVVVMDCCPAVCYKIFPCCLGDPESPLWQEWYKHRLQISK